MRISEAFRQYVFEEIRMQGGSGKTIRNYQTALHSFVKCNGDIPATLITHDCLLRWKVSLSDAGKSNATIKSYLTCVRMILKHLRRRGHDVLDFRDIELPSLS